MITRVAIVAGPDAGHVFPALALATRHRDAGDEVVVFSGERWIEPAARAGIELRELPGLRVVDSDDDADAGQKLSVRAARIAQETAPVLDADGTELVVYDVLTVGGGWAAEMLGLPAIELSPHPLYLPSRGLPPIGSGLAPGVGIRGRLRDVAMRAATATSIRAGERQRAQAREGIGLPASAEPTARFVATLPALEVPRPDWPDRAHLIGPLLWEPTDELFERPTGAGPLVMIAPSTAETGAADMLETALGALSPRVLGRAVRVAVSGLGISAEKVEELCASGGFESGSVISGSARQDELLASGDVSAVICGGGHGLLAKALGAGVPVVTVPGGGDQWELACRVERGGLGRCVRPATEQALADALRDVLDAPAYRDTARVAAAGARRVADPVVIAHQVLAGKVTGCA